MSQGNRSVQISAEDAGLADLMEKLKKQGTEMYRTFESEAKKQTNDLQGQHRIINQLIERQRDKLAMLREEQRIVEQMRLAERLDSARSSSEIRDAKEYHQSAMRDIGSEAQRQGFVMGQAGSHNQNDGGGGGRREFRSRLGGMRRGAGAAVAGMTGGALAGGLFSIIGNMFNEGAALEESSIGLRNLTGTTRGTPGLGLKTSDAQQHYRNFAKQAGVGNLGNISDMMRTERQMGMDIGGSSDLLRFSRQGGGDVGGLMRRVLGMAEKSGIWNIEKGDFSAMNEKMQQIGSLMEEQKRFQEDGINGTRAAGLLGQFAQLGGGFADDRAGGRLEALSEGIRSPVNDFIKAMMMSGIIRGSESRGESTDLFGVRQRMEQGMAGANVFSDVFSEFQQNSGGNRRQMEMMLGIAFPSLMGNQKALSMLSDPSFDPGMFSETGIEDFISSGGEMSLGGRATAGTVMSNKARIQDTMANTGIQMIEQLGGVMEMLINGFEKIPKLIDSLLNLGGTIKNLFTPGKTEDAVKDVAEMLGHEPIRRWKGDRKQLFGNYSVKSYQKGSGDDATSGVALTYDSLIDGKAGTGEYNAYSFDGATQEWFDSLSQEDIKLLFAAAKYRVEKTAAGNNRPASAFGTFGVGSAKTLLAGSKGEDIPVSISPGMTTTDDPVVKAINSLVQALNLNTSSRGGKSAMQIKTSGKDGK